MVLGSTVDLCALPYLLRLISRVLTERASPFGRSQSALTVPVREGPQAEVRCIPGTGRSRKRASPLLGQTFWSEKRAGVGSERRSSLARPSGRRGGLESKASAGPPWPGLPVGGWIAPGLSLGFWAGPGVARRSQRRLLGRAFAGKQVPEGPRVYEPDNRSTKFLMS